MNYIQNKHESNRQTDSRQLEKASLYLESTVACSTHSIACNKSPKNETQGRSFSTLDQPLKS